MGKLPSIEERRERAKIDFLHPRFTVADVIRATGLSSRDIHNYTAREGTRHLISSVPSGHGSRRYFSLADAITFAIIGKLGGLGVPPAQAAALSVHVRDWATAPAQVIFNENNFRSMADTFFIFGLAEAPRITTDLNSAYAPSDESVSIVINGGRLLSTVSASLWNAYALEKVVGKDWSAVREKSKVRGSEDSKAEREYYEATSELKPSKKEDTNED